MTPPLVYQWTGSTMQPLGRLAQRAAEAFTEGEQYRMEAIEARSWNTHAHQFAWLYDAWLTLPERYAMEAWAQSPTHLRRYALIQTGFCNTQTWICTTKAEAARWAPLLFDTRAAARQRQRDSYGYIHHRPDLHREPHGWLSPQVVRVRVTVEEI